MDKQQASKELSEKLAQMQTLFHECMAISVAAQVPFDLPWGGEGCGALDGYGAGATFYPEGVDNWNKYSDSHQWVASNQTC